MPLPAARGPLLWLPKERPDASRENHHAAKLFVSSLVAYRSVRLPVELVAPTTVRTTLERFQAAGLSWPLPEELTDVALEAKLFAAAGTKQGHRRQIEPDYIQRELKRKHVTLSLLWERVH